MRRNTKRREQRSGPERRQRRRRLGPRARRRRNARIRLAIFSVLTLIVVAIVIVARRPTQVDLPPGALGTWVTSDQRYEGRFFTLSPEQFTIGIDGDGSTHRIKVVLLERVAGRDFYTVTYIVGGDEHVFSFRFDARSRTLVPRSQPNLRWTRRGA